MTGEQLKLLTKMKKLITKGNKRFANRRDRDYLEELLEIGITESLAWQEILTLSSYNYVQDYKPFYSKSENSLVFKKDINGNRVYIKLKIEEYNKKVGEDGYYNVYSNSEDMVVYGNGQTIIITIK